MTRKTQYESVARPAGRRSKRPATQREKRPTAKGRGNEPLDLEPVLHAFWDAEALVSVASQAVMDSIDAGPEASVLRLGVEALEKVADQLEEADRALHRFLRKKAVVKRGAP